MTAEQLKARLYPDKGTSGWGIPQPDWKYIHKELKRKGMTLSLLWVEYRQEHPDGSGYSQSPPRTVPYQAGTGSASTPGS
jgi:transposase